MYQRRLVRTAVLAISTTLGLGAGSAAAKPLETLFVTPTPITDLAMNSKQVAWFSLIPGEYDVQYGELWALDLRTWKSVRLDRRGGEELWSAELLAFAGGRAVWRETYHDIHSDEEAYLYTASLSDRRVLYLRDLYAPWFVWLTDGDSAPLVFAGLGTGSDGTEGPLSRMDGKVERQLTRMASPALFSADGGRVAVAPADPAETGLYGRPVPKPRVDLRRLRGGGLIHRFDLDGLPRAVTLAPTLLTILVEDETGAMRLERYRPGGAFLGATPVGRDTRRQLETDGHWVVFSAGHYVKALDGRTGKVSVLRWIKAPPIDLQAISGRAVWAGNAGGHGRVVAVPLPKR